GLGVDNADKGSMTITGGSITTKGTSSAAFQTRSGATADLRGVTIATTGGGSQGLNVLDEGSTLNRSHLTISPPRGLSSGEADAVAVSNGGSITLANSKLSTTGNAAKGINVEGSQSKFIGSNLTISTTGTIDPTTGFHAQGVFNGTGTPAGPGNTGGGT